MRRVLATSMLVGAGLFVTACSDQHSPLPTEPPISPTLTARSCTSPLQLAALTLALFAPGDLLTFARSTQNNINLKMSRGDIAGARKLALAFVDFTLKSYYQGKLRDPNGDKPPTTAEAAVTLIDGVLCWVGLPPSGLDLTKKADITVTTKVIGKDGGELVAGDKLSGLKVEQGTVSEDALWVITRRDDLAKSGTCVSTTLTQIPLCVDFSVVPAQLVAKPVLVVICQPEDRHPLDRRLAHKLPDNKVELLAVVPDPFAIEVERIGLDCTSTPDFPPSGSSRIGRAVWQFGSLVMRVLGPKRLHAGHSGLGGLLGPKLSPVTAVQVRLSFDVQPSNTEPGSAITPAVQVALRDLGTGALATEITNRIKVGIGTNPGEATLGSDTIQFPSNGIATFANLRINNAGTGYTLVADALSSTFTGDSLIHTPATSTAFDIGGADLAVELTLAPESPTDKQPSVITGVVRNIGNVESKLPGLVFQFGGAEGVIPAMPKTLGAGQTFTFTKEGCFSAGAYTATLVVDRDNVVPELNEANNAATLNFSVTEGAVPVIDGVMCPGEWDVAATRIDFTANVPGGGTTPATVFFRQDATRLFIAVRYERSTPDAGSLSFEFDNNNSGGARENGDDALVYNPNTTIGLFDDVRTNQSPPCAADSPPALCGPQDIDVGGRTDGAGAFGITGTESVYEIVHPLNSGDLGHDFALAGGSAVGWYLLLNIGQVTTTFPGSGFLALTICCSSP